MKLICDDQNRCEGLFMLRAHVYIQNLLYYGHDKKLFPRESDGFKILTFLFVFNTYFS